MRGLYRLLTRWWTAFALAASLALLGAAHAFDRFGDLAPCNLCLKQGENDWWDLPVSCMGGGDVSLEGLAALALGTAPVEMPPLCDAVTWRFLGLSMAGWNALISIALAVFSLLAAKRPKDARAPRP